METRSSAHARSQNEDNAVSPPSTASSAENAAVLTAAQPPVEQPVAPPAMGDGLRAAHGRLAQLLHAAASILEEINLEVAGGPSQPPADVPAIGRGRHFDFPAGEPRDSAGSGSQGHPGNAGDQSQPATSSARDAADSSSSADAASSLYRHGTVDSIGREIADLRLETVQAEGETTSALQQRLPIFREFTSEGGDWAAFQRRFLSHQEMVGWSDAQALRALPATLDDDALASLLTIPRQQRATLQSALRRMSDVYGPPSDVRSRFYDRRRRPKESPLAFRTALLAMARAGYPRMDDETIDAIVLQKMLELARELRIVIQAVDDDSMCSLRAARCIHAHLLLHTESTIAASASTSEPASRDAEFSPDRAFMATRSTGRRSSDHAGRRNDQQRGRPAPRGDLTCFNCGRRGHISSDCRAPRRRPSASRGQDYRTSTASRQNQASRDASHARPSFTPYTLQRTIRRARDSACDGGYSGVCSRPLKPGQWSELAHRVVAATAGSSVVVGSIEGVEFRVLVDTGASATIISDLIYNILPVRCRPLERVSIPCFAANGSSLGIIGQIRAQISIGDIKLAGPILVSSSLAVPCLLGTDFLAKMPIKILVDQGCIELPSGRRMAFLPTPSHPRMASASVQAFLASTVRIPPGTQMLVPLQLKKPLAPEASAHGILLGPSNAAAKGLDLVAAQTLVAADREPFLQVLNVGLSTTIIPQGTVLAHATPVPLGTGVAGHVHATPQVLPPSESDERWLDALCKDTGDLSHSQRFQLRALLREFSDVFSKSKFYIGCTKLLRHHIDTGDAAPIRQNPFRLSPAEKQHVKSAVDDMLKADIISPSTSPWGAPIVLVKKHDGSLRFCVDFRRLNKISVADAYPLPRMDESLDALAGAHYFSTLDLLSGFWQLPLDESSKPKTAFRTPQGLFEFNRLPMGLHSAPATFQRLMELVLAGLQWDSCLIYLDDVIVFSRTFGEHIERLRAVFLKIRAANLKFKPQKCHLLRESVRYLGHIVSRSGISTDPEKTKCVQHWPTPTSAGDVRSFIGFASYYRRFVAGFATIAKPLHALTSKGVAFHWGDVEQAAFDSLRNALVTAPSLAYPDFSVPFVLDTDASNTGIGGVLSQKVDGIERVVAYGSRVLSLAEQRYCVTRRELLAIVFFIQQYRPYLYGQHFTVRSDHSALQYALRVDQPSGQLSRWLEVLQDYDFNVTYRRGAQHTNADALSRLPPAQKCACFLGSGRCKPPLPAQVAPLTTVSAALPAASAPMLDHADPMASDDLLGLTLAEWGRHQGEDMSLLRLRRHANNAVPRQGKFNSFVMKRGLLMHWDADSCQHKIVVPSALRCKAVWAAHERLLHLGVHKTIGLLRLQFFWPGMLRDVTDILLGCTHCAQRKPPAKPACPPLQPISVSRINELVALDILGPFPTTPRGNKYLLVGVEYFTRWPMAWALPNQSAAAVVDAFVQGYVLDKGAPERLLTDQGRNFSGALLTDVCRLLGTKKVRTSPYHPQTDGMVERLHRTLTAMLCHQVDESHLDWDLQVPGVLAAYRMAPHAATGFSPFFLMYGRDAFPPADVRLEIEQPPQKSKLVDHLRFNLRKLAEAREAAIENSASRQRANLRLRDPRSYTHRWAPGDRAWLHCPQVPVSTSAKLLRPWRGPVEVVEVLRPQCVKISWGRRRWCVHPSRLKPFVTPRVPPQHTRHGGRVCDASDEPDVAPLVPNPQRRRVIPPADDAGVTAPCRPRSASMDRGAAGVPVEMPKGPPDALAHPPPSLVPPTKPAIPYDGPAKRTRAKSRRL
ncbi:uncharacterized protein LOC142922927 [Petromyzon marinus]|uniref:uncharacterized protein LOC142922927 n=2 Tax=Petromyzon marinus TaxID=7757 RepID=UPI003F7243A6